jgi:hypothetical protein
MFRFLPYCLFFACSLSHAACALSQSDAGEVSISVSGNGPCFHNEQQRQAFAVAFRAAVNGDATPRARSFQDRHEALSGFDHLRRQSEVLNRGPVYYGQRH